MTRLTQILALLGLALTTFTATAAQAETFTPPPAGLERLSPLAPLLTAAPAPARNLNMPATATPRFTPNTYIAPTYNTTPTNTAPVYMPTYTPTVYAQPTPALQPVYQPAAPAFWPNSQDEALALNQVQYMQQASISWAQRVVTNPYASPAEVNAALNNLAYWNKVMNWKVQQMQAARLYQY